MCHARDQGGVCVSREGGRPTSAFLAPSAVRIWSCVSSAAVREGGGASAM